MDYIFYRIYNYYAKKDNIPFTTSIGFVITIYATILFLLVISFNIITGDLISYKYIKKDIGKFAWIAILLLLTFYNIYRYKQIKSIDVLNKQYKTSSLNDKIKTWQIFLIPILIFLLAIIITIIF